jgi:hypothetical protein
LVTSQVPAAARESRTFPWKPRGWPFKELDVEAVKEKFPGYFRSAEEQAKLEKLSKGLDYMQVIIFLSFFCQ